MSGPAGAITARSRSPILLVVGLTALALGLRWACLNQSLFGDELFLWAIVDDRSLRQVFSVVHDTEKTPPLGFLLSWLFTHVSESPEVVRVPSFVASVATVPLVYLLGLRTVGRAAAVVAAAWFALSPFEIFYGTESRSYALVTAFVVLSTLALLAALDDRRPRWWALYAIAAIAAIYSHYIAVLALAPQAAWALWAHRESARDQLIAHAVVVVAFLPWLPSFIVQLRHSADEARRIAESVPLTLTNVAEFAVKPLLAHPYVPLADIPGRVSLAVLGALLLGLAIALLASVKRGSARLMPFLLSPNALIALLALAPLVGLVLYSLRPSTSFLLPRNLSTAVPYALLLIGWLLTFPRSRIVAAALSLVALAALSVGTVRMLDDDYQRTDAEAAARFIDAQGAPSAPVVDLPGPHAIRTYLGPSRRVYTTDEFGRAEWAAALRADSPVFLSFARAGLFVGGFGPPAPYDSRFRLAREFTAPGVPFELGIQEYVPR